jgi:hypothetical protein
MKHEDIASWLDSDDRDWDRGLALFSAFGTNKNMLRVLAARGRSQKTLNDLSYELSKIAGHRTVLRVAEASSISRPVKHAMTETGEQPDPILEDLNSRKNSIFKEYVLLFHQLEFVSKTQRGFHALRILSMWDEIRSLWDQIDYYVKFKVLPPKPGKNPQEETDQVAGMRRLLTLRTYITRYEKKILSCTTEKARMKWQHKLDEYQVEKMDLERKLTC